MKKVKVFNCRIRRKPHTPSTGGTLYQLVREFVVGKDDVLLQGTFLTCRDAMERYHHKLVSDPEQFVVQWCDEFSFMVHQIVDEAEIGKVQISS